MKRLACLVAAAAIFAAPAFAAEQKQKSSQQKQVQKQTKSYRAGTVTRRYQCDRWMLRNFGICV